MQETRARHDYRDEPIALFCKDQSTGMPGRIDIRDDEMRLELFSFEKEYILLDDHERTLQLSNGHYASLIDCVPSLQSRSGGMHGSGFVCTQHHITPNMVILGERAWASHDVVRSIQFRFVGANEALHYFDHSRGRFEAVSEETKDALHTHTIDYSKLEILNAQGGGVHVWLWMSVTTSLGIDPETHSEPVILINLEEGVDVSAFLSIAHDVLTFFEMSLGVRSRMREIYIGTLTEQEQRVSLESGGNLEKFRVRLCFADWLPSGEPTHPGDVAYPVHSPDGRETAKAALCSWLERRQVWKTAYGLASAYLRVPDSYDRDRLLRLFAWFEAIPLYQQQSGISGSQISKLAKAASQKAQELAIAVDKKRLSEVLGELKRTPLNERMLRAVNCVRERFGSVISQEIEEDCREAVRCRNLTAHGKSGEDAHSRSFIRAIEAAQMICFLSMLVDLELFHSPASGHPLMRYNLPWRE